jgi:hypothetical protein
MKNTRDELMEEYSRILTATDESPRPMTDEEYRNLERGIYSTPVGETTWEPPGKFETLDISDVSPSTPVDESTWNPLSEPESVSEKPIVEEIGRPGDWPKKVKLPDGSTKEIGSLDEWRELVKEREPSKMKEKKYSDEEVMEMIKKDPSDVVTGLMLQRKPEYRHLMYPIIKAFVDWLTETGLPVEKNSIMHNELLYMFGKLKRKDYLKEVERQEKEEE